MGFLSHPLRDGYRGFQSARWRWRYRGRRPVILIHQMARVGSITVLRALRRRSPRHRLMHTHYLHEETIASWRRKFDRYHRATGLPGYYRGFLTAELVRRRAARGGWGDWRVITMVRDPVARTLSAFFRHLPLNHPELGLRFRDDPRNVSALIDLFLDPSEPEHDFTLGWFDREVRDVLGTDVFSEPFPTDRGFSTYESAAGPLLLLRTESLATAGPEALGAFLDVDPLPLPVANRSDDLPYSATYKRFLAELRLPTSYLDRMYGSRLARHFYQVSELDSFRRRWTRP